MNSDKVLSAGTTANMSYWRTKADNASKLQVAAMKELREICHHYGNITGVCQTCLVRIKTPCWLTDNCEGYMTHTLTQSFCSTCGQEDGFE